MCDGVDTSETIFVLSCLDNGGSCSMCKNFLLKLMAVFSYYVVRMHVYISTHALWCNIHIMYFVYVAL